MRMQWFLDTVDDSAYGVVVVRNDVFVSATETELLFFIGSAGKSPSSSASSVADATPASCEPLFANDMVAKNINTQYTS